MAGVLIFYTEMFCVNVHADQFVVVSMSMEEEDGQG
jgi:hypothetical protein